MNAYLKFYIIMMKCDGNGENFSAAFVFVFIYCWLLEYADDDVLFMRGIKGPS